MSLAVPPHGVGEIELVLIHRPAGGRRDPLAVHAHLDLAGVQRCTQIVRGPDGKGKVSVAGLCHILQIRDDGGRVFPDSRVIRIRLLGHIADGQRHLLHGGIAVFPVEGEVIGLVPGQGRSEILPVRREIHTVIGGRAVAELYPQRFAVGIDEIGIKREHIVFQLVICDLAVAQIRYDARTGVVGRAGSWVIAGLARVNGLIGIIRVHRVVRVDGIIRFIGVVGVVRCIRGVRGIRGIRGIRGVRRIRRIRCIRRIRRIGCIRGVRGVRRIGCIRGVRCVRRVRFIDQIIFAFMGGPALPLQAHRLC